MYLLQLYSAMFCSQERYLDFVEIVFWEAPRVQCWRKRSLCFLTVDSCVKSDKGRSVNDGFPVSQERYLFCEDIAGFLWKTTAVL